jgi:hypothetical protein
MTRDLKLAAEQLAETIRYRLVTFPESGVPVVGLSDRLVADLANTIAAALDEYGDDR